MIIYDKIYKTHGLSKTQEAIISLVGKNKTILEVGSSTGYMTQIFWKNNCTIDIVEKEKEALKKIPRNVRQVLNYSIEDPKIHKLLKKDYDFIIFADVLEHLINPEKVLQTLHKIAPKKCFLIISLPNIAAWSMRKQLFFKGDFEYQDSGLLDKTHLHFYTPQTLPQLLIKNNWEVDRVIGTITRLPFEGFVNKLPIIGWLFFKFLYKKVVERFPNLSYYHFITIAYKR